MTYSKFTSRLISTGYQDRGRGGTKIDRIVLHHMASTGFEGVLSMWTNMTRQGSANYAVSNEGLVVNAVQEENRSWSLANYAYDARSITFEIENESLGGAWPVSQKAHEAVALVVADICQRYGIACDRGHIVTHREVAAMGYSYSTACPGGLNADWIVARANQIIAGSSTPTPETNATKEDSVLIYRAKSNSKPEADGTVLIRGGYSYLSDGTGPLIPLSKQQYDAYVWNASDGNSAKIPFRVADWQGDDIRRNTQLQGVAEHTWAGLIPIGTGRIYHTIGGAPEFPVVKTAA